MRGRANRTTQVAPVRPRHPEGAHHTHRTRGRLPPVRWCDPGAGCVLRGEGSGNEARQGTNPGRAAAAGGFRSSEGSSE